MFAEIGLVACLLANPGVCEQVTPDMVREVTGESITFHECMGIGGQTVAQAWQERNPAYKVTKVRCGFGNDRQRLRNSLQDTPA